MPRKENTNPKALALQWMIQLLIEDATLVKGSTRTAF
jgi:hypothetical protein